LIEIFFEYQFLTMDCPVLPKVFSAISVVDVDTILGCTDAELRPVLSCLVRMSLIAPMDHSTTCLQGRTAVLQVLSRIELVNSIVALLSIDFHSLELDVKKEQQLKQKLGGSPGESILISNITTGPALEFERSDPTRKLRLVLSELMTIMVKEDGQAIPEKIILKSSELFDHKVYLNEVCDVLAIALAELPALLQPKEVCEALLSVKHGPEIICHIVANQADCFLHVCFHLLAGQGTQQEDDEENIRQEALILLARMCPSYALTLRSRCVDELKMPDLAILLTLEHGDFQTQENDIVEFMTGLLLGGGQQAKTTWMSQYIRNAQKRKCHALTLLRQELTRRLGSILSQCSDKKLPGNIVMETSYLLRLFCALRGIAGMKFLEDEINLLLEVITRHPPATPAGVKLVSLGLSMLIAFNSLISTPVHEKQATDWIRWLVREEAYFESVSGCAGSFGEMLLLIAINFHAGQLSAIVDLVQQTISIKVTVRTNTITRMKQIFINDIFPESTVAAHAVKVPVTHNLSAEIQGFLPVHCMHQLLKSRVFSKHKVSIKSWIYKQICSAASPLHPVLPSLIEAYVQSILVPPSHRTVHTDQLNQPLSEQEIRDVFSKVVIDKLSGVGNLSLSGATPTSRAAPLGGSRRDSRQLSPSKPQSRQRKERTVEDNLCMQICVLYYILLYEDVRLANMKNILSSGRKVIKYSAELLAELPVKFLLSAAETNQGRLEGMFPSLLRLCSTQFPHLCLVEDWIRAESVSGMRVGFGGPLSPSFLEKSLKNVTKCPARTVMALQSIQDLPASRAWDLAEVLINNIRDVIKDGVPRQVQELYRGVWMNLNSVYPRKLWLLTVNNLTPKESVISRSFSQEELSLDPLAVLRCEPKVFRSGPMLSIVLYMLKACLAASRSRLSQHLLDQQPSQLAGQTGEIEKEELKNALVLTQESAAIQILLECCVPTDAERFPPSEGGSLAHSEVGSQPPDRSKLTALQEIQSLICCYLHEAFIADPNLAKLVHFQGYPMELVPMTVAGVPSMHICLDFAPELLSQPSLDKQVFAIDLISQLSVQYSLPKSLSTARLAVNSVSTLLSVLATSTREDLILSTLPAMERVCEAFPPLTDDVISLLIQAGRMCLSSSTLGGYSSPTSVAGFASPTNYDMTSDLDNNKMSELIDMMPTTNPICEQIVKTFRTIISKTVLAKRIF